jgi:hypothetical protein
MSKEIEREKVAIGAALGLGIRRVDGAWHVRAAMPSEKILRE